MYPVTHMVLAASSVRGVERLWQALGRQRRAAGASGIDYRLVALGSLLPDAIDKPLAKLGPAILGYDQTSRHTIGHTLLVSSATIALGLVMAQRGERRLLWLGLGCLTHLLVDPVIVYPSVLFWPAFGWDFPRSDGIPSSYLQLIDAVLVTGGLTLLRSQDWRDRAWSFLRTGAFPGPLITEHEPLTK